MKLLLKGFIIVAVMLSFAATAGAEEEPTTTEYEKESVSLSFNYGDNTFSVTDDVSKDSETELTVMLIKGDYTEASLATVTSSDICYIGQSGGLKYCELFNNLGVKYTGGKFVPGVYTLVTSGYGMDVASKTKIYLGNAVNADASISEYMHSHFADNTVDFGTMSQTLRVYEEAYPEQYIYVGVGEFKIDEAVTTDNLGFVVQKQDQNGELQKGYQSLKAFGITALDNVASLEGTLNVGIQINGLANTTEIVAIPFVITD